MEQPFTWLSGDSIDPFGLANHLLQLMLAEKQQGRHVAEFMVLVNPACLGADNPDAEQLSTMVSAYMSLLAERTGMPLAEVPIIRIEPDTTVDRRLATVVAHEEAIAPAAHTQLLAQDATDNVTELIRELDAFLIVQGRQHAPLDQPVIRIGRRTDNDIVLDSPAVSRHHAQIRWRDAYFVLFDTSSHGRTIVNGERVQEHVLQPGDVIALSDVLLIYGEERALSEPLSPHTGDVSSTLLKPSE